MATFTLIVGGIIGTDFFSKTTEVDTSCRSIFDNTLKLPYNAAINITHGGGSYTNYTVMLDTGSGYISIPSSYNFTSTKTAKIKIYMGDTAIVDEDLNVFVRVSNTTTLENQTLYYNRTSDGVVC